MKLTSTITAALLIAVCAALLPSTAGATCVIDPTLSYCNIDIIRNDACPPGTNTLVWCPAGDLSLISVTIGIVDVGNVPCPGCPVDVDFRFQGQPSIAGCDIWVCGTVGGNVTLSGVTNAVGEVTFTFTGGGCGCLLMDFIATAGGTVICQQATQFCVKSPDLTGDGNVIFFDTFKFLPMLNSAQGYCGDFNCDNTVNFFDVFQYLPHLNGGHQCTGSAVPITSCPVPCF